MNNPAQSPTPMTLPDTRAMAAGAQFTMPFAVHHFPLETTDAGRDGDGALVPTVGVALAATTCCALPHADASTMIATKPTRRGLYFISPPCFGSPAR
jgi:hypothetical protein